MSGFHGQESHFNVPDALRGGKTFRRPDRIFFEQRIWKRKVVAKLDVVVCIVIKKIHGDLPLTAGKNRKVNRLNLRSKGNWLMEELPFPGSEIAFSEKDLVVPAGRHGGVVGQTINPEEKRRLWSRGGSGEDELAWAKNGPENVPRPQRKPACRFCEF